jgi:hypothetical protein
LIFIPTILSFDISLSSVAVSSRFHLEMDQVEELNNSSHCQEMSPTLGVMASNLVNGVALAAAYQEDIHPVAPGPQEEGKQPQDAATLEESAEARLERLGRQRPEVFHSTWSEIGFVFSISMSQVLSVSLPFENLTFTTDLNRNILFLASLSFSPLWPVTSTSQLHHQHGLPVLSP